MTDFRESSCTSKTAYSNRAIAEKVRRKVEAREGEPFKVYGCPLCGYFHLTGCIEGHRLKGA